MIFSHLLIGVDAFMFDTRSRDSRNDEFLTMIFYKFG